MALRMHEFVLQEGRRGSPMVGREGGSRAFRRSAALPAKREFGSSCVPLNQRMGKTFFSTRYIRTANSRPATSSGSCTALTRCNKIPSKLPRLVCFASFEQNAGADHFS